MGGGDPAGMMVGMAVGRVVGGQVAGMMNNAMQDMNQKIPPVPNSPSGREAASAPAVSQYNVAVNGQTTGPFDLNTLAQMARNSQLTPQSLVWKHGMTAWASAGTVQELAGLFGQKENTMYDEKNFYSLDRLVNFGMSTAAAQQMVNTMNHTIENLRIPGAGNPMRSPDYGSPELVYYALIDGKQAGPFSETELARLINDRKLRKETYVWHLGLDEWKTVENIPAILRLVALAPPPPPETAGTGAGRGNPPEGV